jgi:predicted metal-dependent hydrolase
MDKKKTGKTEYNVDYRNVKHPRLEFKTGTLLLILPKNSKNEKETLQKYTKWIQKKEFTIKTALKEAKIRSLNKARTDKELRSLTRSLVQNYQAELSTKINKIYFKKMKTKWASHSHNGNLTVNTLLKYLPQDIIEYVIYHEITHALERKHNERFWNILNRKFHDYESKEKDLLTYWFIIQKTHAHARWLISATDSKTKLEPNAVLEPDFRKTP